MSRIRADLSHSWALLHNLLLRGTMVILLAVSCIILGSSAHLPGSANAAHAATPTPSAADPSPTPPLSAAFPDVASLPKCATPTVQSALASRPAHPYAAGDPVCDARSFAVSRPQYHGTQPGSPYTHAQPANCTTNASTGILSSTDAWGLYSIRQVTAPTLDSDDTIYVTMHTGYNGNWAEVGWAQHSPSDARKVFIADRYFYKDFPAYVLNTGMYITVESLSVGGNWWDTMLYWNGMWQVLHQHLLNATYSDEPNVVVEEDTGGDCHGLILPGTNTSSTQVEIMSGGTLTWAYQGPSVPNTVTEWNDPPYSISVYSPYYNWSVQGGP